jgi:hypothetical protein
MSDILNSLDDLPSDPQLGDVVRVYVDGPYAHDTLFKPVTVLKWSGREWVHVNGLKPLAMKLAGTDHGRCPGTPHRGHTNSADPCPFMFKFSDVGPDDPEKQALLDSLHRALKTADHMDMNDRLSRLADVQKRYGVSQVNDGVADILVRYLPPEFVRMYSALIDMMTGPGTGYAGSGLGVGDENAIQGVGKKRGGLGLASSGGSESLSLKNKVKGKGESPALVKSERAMVMRSKMDRALRKLARQMKIWLREEVDAKIDRRKCSGKCGRFGESDWIYCAKCGGPMYDVK